MTDEKPDATKPQRKKSQKRQRNWQIKVPCLEQEFNDVAAAAQAAGMTRAAYARTMLLGEPGPRAQRRLPVDAELLRDTLGQLGRLGNNVNQLAYQANAHGELPMEAELREDRRRINEVCDLIMAALGKNPSATHDR